MKDDMYTMPVGDTTFYLRVLTDPYTFSGIEIVSYRFTDEPDGYHTMPTKALKSLHKLTPEERLVWELEQ